MGEVVGTYMTILIILLVIRSIMWLEYAMSPFWFWRSFVWPLEFLLLLFKATKEIWSDYTK